MYSPPPPPSPPQAPTLLHFFSSSTSSSRNVFHTESDVLISSIQMGSAIWYEKRNDGGTKEGEKLRKRNDGEGTVFADGIKRRRENHPRRKKKKKAREIDSADNSRLHHWFCRSSFLTCHSYIYILRKMLQVSFSRCQFEKKEMLFVSRRIYLRWLILNTIEKLRRNDKLR